MNDYSIVPADNPEWQKLQVANTLTPIQVNKQLMVLATAYPTIVRKYDQYEYKATQELWYEIFKNVPEELFQEAVKRYIINDTKGFFPAPGQIVGIITEIVKQRKAEEFHRFLLHRTYSQYKEGEG